MDGAELQELLRTLLPDEVLLEVATATGFHQHRRRLAEGRRGRLPRGGRGGLAFDARGAYFFFRRIHTT